jgi:spore coat polysaccharide biosynthesis protein SpsF
VEGRSVTAEQVAIVVQARMSSVRLPGKVLAPLAGAPAIVRMMERVGRVTRAAHQIVATSVEPSDDVLAAACLERGISCVRGPLDDVLARVVSAVPVACEAVVRLTADCPMIDPALVDEHIQRFEANRASVDYVSNALVRTYPHGLDVEVMSRAVLLEANARATLPHDREHVTPWIQRRCDEGGRHLPVTQAVDLSALRWVLDTEADYEVIAAIYAALYERRPAFDSRAVHAFLLERPDLIRVDGSVPVNTMIARMRERLGLEVEA